MYQFQALGGHDMVCLNANKNNTHTDELDVIGHPAEEDPLMYSSLPVRSREHGAPLQQHGELGQAAEEEDGEGGGQEGQVLVQELLQLRVILFAS